MQFYLNKII